MICMRALLFGIWVSCMQGPGVRSLSEGCRVNYDLDRDGDVDLRDYAIGANLMQHCVAGHDLYRVALEEIVRICEDKGTDDARTCGGPSCAGEMLGRLFAIHRIADDALDQE